MFRWGNLLQKTQGRPEREDGGKHSIFEGPKSPKGRENRTQKGGYYRRLLTSCGQKREREEKKKKKSKKPPPFPPPVSQGGMAKNLFCERRRKQQVK